MPLFSSSSEGQLTKSKFNDSNAELEVEIPGEESPPPNWIPLFLHIGNITVTVLILMLSLILLLSNAVARPLAISIAALIGFFVMLAFGKFWYDRRWPPLLVSLLSIGIAVGIVALNPDRGIPAEDGGSWEACMEKYKGCCPLFIPMNGTMSEPKDVCKLARCDSNSDPMNCRSYGDDSSYFGTIGMVGSFFVIALTPMIYSIRAIHKWRKSRSSQ